MWLQQQSYIKEEMKEETYEDDVDPRAQFLIGFEKWVQDEVRGGHRLIVLTDANQSIEDKTEGYNLGDLIDKCSLDSVMEVKHKGASLRSLERFQKPSITY